MRRCGILWFSKRNPTINSLKALKLKLSHLFQTKICKTHLLQKWERKFVKIFLQRRVTFPLHVLFMDNMYAATMQSNHNSLCQQFRSLSSQVRASPGHLRFTISSESPKAALKLLMNLKGSSRNHIMGFWLKLILQFCFPKSTMLSSPEHHW